MSSKPPPKDSAPPQKTPDKKDEKAPVVKQSGRVAFDSRGNAVWEWEMKTGVYGRDVDTKRLKKLEAKELKIVEDPPKQDRKPDAAAQKPARAGGFDPYNSSNTVKNRALDQLTGGHKPFKKQP